MLKCIQFISKLMTATIHNYQIFRTIYIPNVLFSMGSSDIVNNGSSLNLSKIAPHPKKKKIPISKQRAGKNLKNECHLRISRPGKHWKSRVWVSPEAASDPSACHILMQPPTQLFEQGLGFYLLLTNRKWQK